MFSATRSHDVYTLMQSSKVHWSKVDSRSALWAAPSADTWRRDLLGRRVGLPYDQVGVNSWSSSRASHRNLNLHRGTQSFACEGWLYCAFIEYHPLCLHRGSLSPGYPSLTTPTVFQPPVTDASTSPRHATIPTPNEQRRKHPIQNARERTCTMGRLTLDL